MITEDAKKYEVLQKFKDYSSRNNVDPRVLRRLNKLFETTNIRPSGRTNLFKSIMHEMAFYFDLNMPQFDKYLGISKVHMVDKEKALELRKVYFSMFHPDLHIGSDNEEINCNEVMANIRAYFDRVCGALK
ncbi:hypothetical protein [Pantoea agglomerans]|uniref:hypothetical protein n=1 Tax=Enterobacter agglomerans TaxID=549 RepID=UPI003C7CF124